MSFIVHAGSHIVQDEYNINCCTLQICSDYAKK